MKIITIRLEQLRRPKRNVRMHTDSQIAEFKRSVEMFGQIRPIVVDEEHTILAGNGLYDTLLALGRDEADCFVVAGLSDNEKKKLMLADNRIFSLGSDDMDAIDDIINDLKDDLDIPGFDDDMLQSLLANGSMVLQQIDSQSAGYGYGMAQKSGQGRPPAEVQDDSFDVEQAVDEIKAPVAKPGDIWLLGRHRLMCGDSTKPADVRELFDGQTAIMCVTDPPWNVAIGGKSNPLCRQREGIMNDNMSAEKFAEFLNDFLAAVSPMLEGDMYCCLGTREWPTLDKAMRNNGYHWSGTIVWVKDAFVLGRSNYHKRYEPLWYGWKEGVKSSFNGERNLDDVWEFKRPRSSPDHPTMKPIELWGEAIRNSSNPGDIIVDPFGGSGTAIIASEQMDRTCFTMELDPKYCDVIIRRWETLTGETAVLANG
jgi:DNA modification methylase